MNKAQQLREQRALDVESFFNGDIYNMITNEVNGIITRQNKLGKQSVEIRFVQCKMLFRKIKVERDGSQRFTIYFDERNIRISQEEIVKSFLPKIRKQGFYVDDILWSTRLYISWKNL